jgi:hypothetical protein
VKRRRRFFFNEINTLLSPFHGLMFVLKRLPQAKAWGYLLPPLRGDKQAVDLVASYGLSLTARPKAPASTSRRLRLGGKQGKRKTDKLRWRSLSVVLEQAFCEFFANDSPITRC